MQARAHCTSIAGISDAVLTLRIFPEPNVQHDPQPKTCGRFLHAAVAAHRFRRGRRVADLATSDERGGGPVDLLFTQVRWPAGLPSAASDHALRHMAPFGRITNLLMMRELILHRQDFHYLAAFERPGGKVSYFGRLARGANAPYEMLCVPRHTRSVTKLSSAETYPRR